MFKRNLVDPKTGSISLRCFAQQHEGYAIAACLDLCLAAQAEDMEEARAKLHEQIVDYLADAQAERNFESRPAPLEYWAKYYSISAKNKLAELGISLDGISARFSDVVPLNLSRA